MSLSDKERESNIALALTLMMQGLDPPFDWQEHDSTEAKFSGVHRTTWEELMERAFARATIFDLYVLTPSGWIEGHKLMGTFENADFKAKAGRLSGALKARVKGRHRPELADRNDVADETGLDEFFVMTQLMVVF